MKTTQGRRISASANDPTIAGRTPSDLGKSGSPAASANAPVIAERSTSTPTELDESRRPDPVPEHQHARQRQPGGRPDGGGRRVDQRQGKAKASGEEIDPRHDCEREEVPQDGQDSSPERQRRESNIAHAFGEELARPLCPRCRRIAGKGCPAYPPRRRLLRPNPVFRLMSTTPPAQTTSRGSGPAAGSSRIAIALHGGAGTIRRAGLELL